MNTKVKCEECVYLSKTEDKFFCNFGDSDRYGTEVEVGDGCNDGETDEMIESSKSTSMIVNLNENEKIFVSKMEHAMKYCKGELELDLEGQMWIARDYRENLEGAFPIDVKGFTDEMISISEADNLGIDVRKCCDYCNIFYVG